MRFAILIAALAVAAAAQSPLESARDRQDRAALEKIAAEDAAGAAKAGRDAAAQLQEAVAYSYLAEVEIELHDRKAGRQAAEQGIKAAERAVALNSNSSAAYRVLGTLYGQAVTDVFSGLSYGPKAKDALAKAVSLANTASASSEAWTAQGVGNYYVPPQLGGGAGQAIADFRKAIELDPKNAEAWLWLGVALRKNNQEAEARQAFTRSLDLNPKRVWVKQQFEKTPAK